MIVKIGDDVILVGTRRQILVSVLLIRDIPNIHTTFDNNRSGSLEDHLSNNYRHRRTVDDKQHTTAGRRQTTEGRQTEKGDHFFVLLSLSSGSKR